MSTAAKPRKSLYRRLAIAAVATSLILALLFAADLGLGAYVRASATDTPLRIPSDLYHHDLAPSRTMGWRWGEGEYVLTTNSLGFRDSSERSVPLEADGPRILFMGDSFLEGIGSPFEVSAMGRITRALAEQGIEALCGAAVSYCPIIYWRKTKYLLEEKELEVDAVVVFIDISDIYDSTTYKLNSSGDVVKSNTVKRVQEFVERKGYFMRKISKSLYRAYAERVNEDVETSAVPIGEDSKSEKSPKAFGMNRRQGLWTVDDELFASYGKHGLELATRYMDRLRAMLDERGLPLTVCVYPWPDQIGRGDLESRQVEHWREWCQDGGVQFVDLFPSFIDPDQGDWKQTISEHFIPGDVHWNAKGNEVAAEAFLSRFVVPVD